MRFEQMRAAFGVLFNKWKVNTGAPVQIVAFRTTKDFRRTAPVWKGKAVELTGFFRGGDDRNFIALDTAAPDRWGTVFHEYAHLLINSNFPPMPTWFDEGFAEYCSSLKVDKKQVRFGLRAEGRATELASTAWMHVAATSAGGIMRLYINGVQESGDVGGPVIMATNSLALGIGAQSDGTVLFQGQIDEARVYNRALSAAEIAQHYGELLQPGASGETSTEGLVQYATLTWELDHDNALRRAFGIALVASGIVIAFSLIGCALAPQLSANARVGQAVLGVGVAGAVSCLVMYGFLLRVMLRSTPHEPIPSAKASDFR
jgi:hypothetical protein